MNEIVAGAGIVVEEKVTVKLKCHVDSVMSINGGEIDRKD